MTQVKTLRFLFYFDNPFYITESAVQYERPLVKLEAVNMNDSTQPPIPSVKLYMDSQPNVMEGDSVTGETQTTIKIIANPQEDQLEVFDAVILTMPAPQILQLKGLVQEALGKNNLPKIYYQVINHSCSVTCMCTSQYLEIVQ